MFRTVDYVRRSILSRLLRTLDLLAQFCDLTALGARAKKSDSIESTIHRLWEEMLER